MLTYIAQRLRNPGPSQEVVEVISAEDIGRPILVVSESEVFSEREQYRATIIDIDSVGVHVWSDSDELKIFAWSGVPQVWHRMYPPSTEDTPHFAFLWE